MSEFYSKYRSLFEEDEMSTNHALRMLMGGAILNKVKYSGNSPEGTPEKKYVYVPEPIKKPISYQLQKPSPSPPQINITHSNAQIGHQKSPLQKINPLKADALNALLDYNKPTKSIPLFPQYQKYENNNAQILKDEPHAGALKNVYKHSLVNASQINNEYYEQQGSKKRFIESQDRRRKEIYMENNSGNNSFNLGINPKESPIQNLLSQVPTAENLFPTPPKQSEKIEDEKVEYKFMRKYRECKMHREKAKKLLRVFFRF